MARLTVEIDDALYKEFKQVCKQTDTDISKTIRSWIKTYLQNIKKNTPKRQKKGITWANR